MKVRKLNKEDVKDVAPLMLSLYNKWDKVDSIDKIDRKWFLSKKQYDYLRRVLLEKDKLFLVVEENNEIFGYLLAEIDERKPFL